METISITGKLHPEITKALLDILLPYGVSRVMVFGSYAKGLQMPESDIDLIVSFNSVMGLFTLGRIREELIEKLGIPVDLLTERAIHPLLKEHILTEAVEIFSNEG